MSLSKRMEVLFVLEIRIFAAASKGSKGLGIPSPFAGNEQLSNGLSGGIHIFELLSHSDISACILIMVYISLQLIMASSPPAGLQRVSS